MDPFILPTVQIYLEKMKIIILNLGGQKIQPIPMCGTLNCESGIMDITSAFQADDVGSIPTFRFYY